MDAQIEREADQVEFAAAHGHYVAADLRDIN
jgi:hypothetical protein